ncbi:hypothetical protein SNL152K_10637 [Streptomyces sp. NL15-2K]|nr:hypothetical protein SNL152K_10637 [Streptomyces sp. NL15-2K]
MHRDQGRRARRVDRHGRPLEPERVGQPTGDDTLLVAGPQVALQVGRCVVDARAVLLWDHARERAGVAAADGGRVDTRPLQRLPRQLQQQPLLRIDRQRLPRRDPEETRIELRRLIQKPTTTRIRRPRMIGIRVIQPLQIPTPVHRKPVDRIPAPRNQLPQTLRRPHTPRKTARHRHHRDRLVVHDRSGGDGCPGRGLGRGEGAKQMLGEPVGCRVVEDEGGGQGQSRAGGETVAEFECGERVEAQLDERPPGCDSRRVGVAEYGGDLCTDEVEQDRVVPAHRFLCQSPGQLIRGGARLAGRGRPGSATADVPQHRRNRRVIRTRGQPGGDYGGQARGAAVMQQGMAQCRGQRGKPRPGDPCAVGRGEPAGHRARLVPQSPGDARGRQALVVPVDGEGVEEGVGRRVVRLSRGADDTGHRGIQDEPLDGMAPGEFVEPPGTVRLCREHGAQPLLVEGGHGRVVDHAGQVVDGGEGVLRGEGVEQGREGVAVGDVTGFGADVCAQVGEFGDEFGRVAGAGDQQQVAAGSGGGEVPGQQAAQGTGAPRDQRRARRDCRRRRRRERQAHLAGVPGLGEVTKGVPGVPYVPRGHGERP